MRRFVIAVLLFSAAARGAAAPAGAAFVPTKQGFQWKQGPASIQIEKGNWTAAIEGGGQVAGRMFYWHDHFTYETLAGGTIRSGPTLLRDGSLVLQGVSSTHAPAPALQYACRIQPLADGIHVTCELQKSGPLLINRGLWLHITGQRQSFHGSERVWMEPSVGGTLASALQGSGSRLHIELQNGRAVSVGGPGIHDMDAENTQSHTYRFNVLADDFPPLHKVVVEYDVRFGGLPAQFPGQIQPQRQPLALRGVRASAASVPQYGKLELKVDLAATYNNPFDPDQVRLDAHFTPPSGREIVVPGFFAVDYQRQVQPAAEMLIPQGNGGWRVRFTPQETGAYRWRLELTDRSGQVTGGEGRFDATAAAAPGFVRRSRVDSHYLAFDNGQGYYPIGHNLPSYHTTGQLGDEAMRRFAAAKENYNRWWMHSGGFGLEWAEHLGWYRQDAAARLDLVLDQAVELGQYYMLCMDTHQDFRQQGWERNPFNAKNGGPCPTPADWFTDAAARGYYKNRLRYTVARWGYSPHVLCWEFGNEIEGWANSPDTVKLPWHKEMSDYLRRLDPFGHLITTSFWTNVGPEEYWKLDNLDIVQTHLYTNNDGAVAPQVRDCCLKQRQRSDKPHIFGEFGIRAGEGTPEKDPKGWAIHNGLWAGLFSFAAGGPMPWWHENYLDKLDLYFHFTSLANFTAGEPLGSARWDEPQLTAPQYVDKSRPATLRNINLDPRGSGWTKPEYDEFVVRPDGSVADDRQPAQNLHGDGHRDLRSPPTFVVTYPRPGKFIVRVGKVSRAGRLQIWIDQRQALDRDLPCAEGLGKGSIFRPQYKLWETTYDEDIAVSVPAGRHRIRVDNAGKDWLTVSRYVFTNCLVIDRPNLNLWGMRAGPRVLVWLQNRDSTWVNHAGDGDVGQVDAFRFQLTDLADGPYRVQWWETWKGRILREDEAQATGGRLTIEVPPLRTDVALKVLKKQP